MKTKNKQKPPGWKQTGLVFLLAGTTAFNGVKAQTGNVPALSSENTTNSIRAVLINSNYDGSANANEFIYLRSGPANRNDANLVNTWFQNSQLVVADTIVAVFRNRAWGVQGTPYPVSGSGGAFKIGNRNGQANDRWWLGFTHGDNFADNNDRARIGVDMLAGGSGNLFFTTGPIAQQAERMRITATGNIGIGTTTPNGELQFSNTLINRKIVLHQPQGINNEHQYLGFGVNPGMLRYQVGNAGDNHVFFAGSGAAGSAELMRISGNGNVGIGTSTPTEKLEVNGTVKVNNIWAVSQVITKSVVSPMNESISFSSLVGPIAVERVKITAGGYVGIGTGTPGYKLDVNGTTRTSSLILMGRAGQTGNLLELKDNAGIRLSAFSSDGRLCIQCGPSFATPETLLEIGKDDASNTTTLLRVHGGAKFNNDLDATPGGITQVSINTNKRITNAALTVGGAVYVGTWKNTESALNAGYLERYMLWVEKGIVTEDVAYAPKADWSDYVFDNEYRLTPLGELDTYIKENKHLPGIKSAAEVAKDGYSNHDFNKSILAKVEELTLYIIEQDKKILELEQELDTVKKQ
jgi:hypothetical protein